MAKWMMPIAAALVLAACDMGGQEMDTIGTSGDSMGTMTSGASEVNTMPGYPTGVSSGASDVGSTESSGVTESATDGIITKDQPLQ